MYQVRTWTVVAEYVTCLNSDQLTVHYKEKGAGMKHQMSTCGRMLQKETQLRADDDCNVTDDGYSLVGPMDAHRY